MCMHVYICVTFPPKKAQSNNKLENGLLLFRDGGNNVALGATCRGGRRKQLTEVSKKRVGLFGINQPTGRKFGWFNNYIHVHLHTQDGFFSL